MRENLKELKLDLFFTLMWRKIQRIDATVLEGEIHLLQNKEKILMKNGNWIKIKIFNKFF